MRYSRTPNGRPYSMMRVTAFAHAKLSKIRDEIDKAVASDPESYPDLSCRRLTLSDVIILLCKGYDNGKDD